jgi:hypothetical protein
VPDFTWVRKHAVSNPKLKLVPAVPSQLGILAKAGEAQGRENRCLPRVLSRG